MGRGPRELSRLEREIMDAIYRVGEATAADVADEMSNQDSFDSIRVTLGILEKKGVLKKRRDGNRNVYSPAVSVTRAKRSALRHLLHTFFQGSSSKAILTLMDTSKLSEDEFDEIEAMLRKRRKERRQ